MEKLFILDIPIHKVTRKRATKIFLNFCNHKRQKYFTATPNAEILLESLKNSELKKYLQNCQLNVADSVSLLWAAEVLEKKWGIIRAIFELLFLPFRKKKWTALPERVCGSDLFWDICEKVAEKKLKIFLLGAGPGIAVKTQKILEKKFSKIKIVGAMEGSPLKKEDKTMQKKISITQPDIIFVAYGCPKQELWIARNLKKIPSVKVAMGIGGSFDFAVGKIKRAPKLFRTLGLEWLWRLIQEPRKRGKRIFQAVFVFPWIFLKHR